MQSLEPHPAIQLEYVEKRIQTMNRSEMEMLKIHLNLTAKARPSSMMALVKNEIYPIEEAMKLCE
jgi:hypothetical protein